MAGMVTGVLCLMKTNVHSNERTYPERGILYKQYSILTDSRPRHLSFENPVSTRLCNFVIPPYAQLCRVSLNTLPRTWPRHSSKRRSSLP